MTSDLLIQIRCQLTDQKKKNHTGGEGPLTSEAEEEATDADLLLIGHEEDQPDGGPAHCGVGADGELGDHLVEQQQDGVVAQAGDKVSADTEELSQVGLKKTRLSLLRDDGSPAGRADASPQLDAEQTHRGVLTHLDPLVVDGAENCRDRESGRRHLQLNESRINKPIGDPP